MNKIRAWFETRLGISEISRFLTRKEIPLHKHTIWYYTGSAILLFFGIQVITGILLAFFYQPTLDLAHESVARIITEIPLGWIIRSIHGWSANFMIALVWIHLLSIWLTKSYRKPREFTWMSGVLLLFASLAFGFTGYLLPWDELSLSATKVGTDIPNSIPVIGKWVTQFLRGGEDVTADTLTRFFAFHICVLPIFILLLIAVHIYLIQRHGISKPPEAEKDQTEPPSIPFWPNFVYRESIIWVLLFGVMLTIALLFPRHLGEPADLMAPAPAGILPEWYFLFLFQTLKIFPSRLLFISGETLAVLLIALGAAAFFFLPVLDAKPLDKKGKIFFYAGWLFIIYAAAMSLWSLL